MDRNRLQKDLPESPERLPKGDPAPEAFGQPPQPEAFARADLPAHQEKAPDKDRRRDPDAPDDGKQEKPQKKNDPKKKDEEPEKPPFYKRPLLMTILIAIVLILLLGALLWWLHARNFESTDDAFIDGHVIPISPKVAAIVKDVLIDDNTPVKAGDVLVRLDPSDYQATLDQKRAAEAAARGKLAQAQTQLEVAKANVGQADAAVVVAQTNADNAARDYERWKALDVRARSQQQLDNALAAQRSTAAQVTEAKAKLTAAHSQVDDAQQAIKAAEAEVQRAAADVRQAEINLAYCTIAAPESGRVTRKSVEPGQYVQVGEPMFSIVPTDVWVTANFKETQLKLMRPGQPVTIKVDAYPDLKLRGTVNSIQNGSGSRFSLLPAENATGNFVKVVQRVPVKITFDKDYGQGSNHLLAPGMSVEPKVQVR